MNRTRLSACLLALALAFPSAAFAQSAGDDQYQDPFGDDAPAQGGAGGTGGGGLSEAPPGAGSGSSGSGSGSGSGSSGSGSGSAGGDPAGAGEDTTAGAAAPDTALPNTGADPRVLAWIAMLLLLTGVGLRLRTIDPDEY